jgi:hypothetical protein
MTRNEKESFRQAGALQKVRSGVRGLGTAFILIAAANARTTSMEKESDAASAARIVDVGASRRLSVRNCGLSSAMISRVAETCGESHTGPQSGTLLASSNGDL